MKLTAVLAASAMTVASARTVRRGRDLGKSSHHYPGPPPNFPPPPEHWGPSYHDSSSSSKSGKSSSSKSGKSSKGGNFKYVWVEGPSDSHWGGHPEKAPPAPFWHGSSSSKSGKSSSSKSGKGSSGKSGKGSWGSSSSKSGKSSGKSGKGSWGSSSSKSSKGSSKSSKGSVKYHHIWVDDNGWGHPLGPPPPPFPFPYGKSGKGPHHHVYYHPKPKPETNDDDDDAWKQDVAPEVSETDWEDDGHDDEDGEWEDDGHDDEDGEWEDDGHDDEDGEWEDDGHGDDDDYSPAVLWEDDGHDDGAWDDDSSYDDDGTGHYPNDICFQNGEIVTCDGAPKGDAVYVEFSYSAETSGVNPEDTISDIEGALLAATVDYVSSLDSSHEGVIRVSSYPDDYISDDEVCTPTHDAHDCSIVKGEMTVYSDDHTMDACDYSNIIEASMDNADFSDISGVKDVEYLDTGSSCAGTSKIVSGEAVVTEEEGLSTGAMIGLAMLGALIAATALLLARKFRRKPGTSDRDFDLISVDTDYEGKRFGSNDPFASTVDVHKCTSMYCNCNKGGVGTTFLPAPRKSNMEKVIKKQGLDTTSPTGVDEADARGFFVGDPEPLEAVSMSDDSSMSQNPSQPNDAIIRADPTSEEGRALTPVREVAHDSEIDTEFESDGEEDLESIPPPPPLPPGMKPKNNSLEADEMSV